MTRFWNWLATPTGENGRGSRIRPRDGVNVMNVISWDEVVRWFVEHQGGAGEKGVAFTFLIDQADAGAVVLVQGFLHIPDGRLLQTRVLRAFFADEFVTLVHRDQQLAIYP